ncbi:MAG: PAS domain-containing protein, partial [Omnitrophica WOR_2 bacterium]
MVENLPNFLPDNHDLLNAIVSTSAEGILVLDITERVLYINTSLAQYLNIAYENNPGLVFRHSLPGKSTSLMKLCGYVEPDWDVSCREITSGRVKVNKGEVKLNGSRALYLSRTHLPVLNRQGEISGWLLIFQDVTK